MNAKPIHTSDRRHVKKLWLILGGRILPIHRTGEQFFVHELFNSPLRVNGRRRDVPAKLLSRLNQLIRMKAANDPRWTTP